MATAVAPVRLALIHQFARFGVAGAIGFLFDTATVYSLRSAVGLYIAGLIGFFVAASVTWSINRSWAFRDQGRTRRVHHQWLLFVTVNFVGFVLNRGTYALLITVIALFHDYPVLALACGAGAGMFVNFFLARRIVFR
jgi:putative flippase GtrA